MKWGVTRRPLARLIIFLTQASGSHALPVPQLPRTWANQERGAQHVFASRNALLAAADAWCQDAARAKATYGDIAGWNVSSVTDMSWLFCGSSWWQTSGCRPFKRTCNPDIIPSGDDEAQLGTDHELLDAAPGGRRGGPPHRGRSGGLALLLQLRRRGG